MELQFDDEVKRLANILPDRKEHKVGRNMIPKETLIEGILMWLFTGCNWEHIPHDRTVRRYFDELQRQGYFLKYLNEHLDRDTRPFQAVMDATYIRCWKNVPYAQYSGKYHNYCIKLTLSITPEQGTLDFSIDPGAKHDSKILDDILSRTEYLPYHLYLDKGYESYERRRWLRQQNCQVHMEQKNYTKNRKRGPCFKCTETDRSIRSTVERFFSFLKKFHLFHYFRFRKLARLRMAIYLALILVS